MLTQAPRGTKDVLPAESHQWQWLEEHIAAVCNTFGYREIRTPVFEHTELFERGVGDTTDVVQKEMYTFDDKGGRSITLRPEGTASVGRAYLEHNLYADIQPCKLFYNISCYRYEKPQAGRLREFHQFGAEVYGSPNPSIDAEVISLAMALLNRVGLSELTLNINSIGCPTCRKAYLDKLRDYLSAHTDELCETCRTRLDKNPMRALDCKVPSCGEIVHNAPMMTDYLCEECQTHFDQVQQYLREMGIPFRIDKSIVRGLDYYTKTVFEIKSNGIGAQSTVCGGGRYDGLIEDLGGSPTPGVGFGMGLERLLLILEETGKLPSAPAPQDLFVISMGERADLFASKLCHKLRSMGISCERDHMGKSIKAQMKTANRLGVRYVVVIGDTELDTDCAKLKTMETGEEREVSLTELLERGI